MQNSERDQVEGKEEVKENKDVSDEKSEDNYQKLMKEGKKVLDSIHLTNAPHQGMFEGQKPREAEPTIIIINPKKDEIKQKMVSQEQELDNQADNESRNQGDVSSKNEHDHLLNMSKKSSKMVVGCNCIKSRCTKNYCECFTQARKCGEMCKCTGCENQGQVIERRIRSNIDPEDTERNCNCKKSNCLKKYCECFNSGVKCTSSCKCEECKNCEAGDNDEYGEDGRLELKRPRSAQEIEELNSKIEEIARLIPQDNQQYILSFLEYWLS